jgi:hypothetical protein
LRALARLPVKTPTLDLQYSHWQLPALMRARTCHRFLPLGLLDDRAPNFPIKQPKRPPQIRRPFPSLSPGRSPVG